MFAASLRPSVLSQRSTPVASFSKLLQRFLGLVAFSALFFCCMPGFAQAPVVVPGSTAVGKTAAAVNVTVTMSAAGTGVTTSALTLGISGADFALASGAACTGSYSVGSQCTVGVVFGPLYPGWRSGAVVVTDGSGNVLGRALVSGKATGSLSVLNPGDIVTVAGDGELIYRQDGVPATSAPVYLPQGMAVDAAGNFFISDTNNDRVRRVDFKSGLISTIAGTGMPGYSGDGGVATSAAISLPSGIALDGAGNIYFADSSNDIVREIDAVTGIITTVVGVPKTQGYTGDNGAATSATLSAPRGIAFDVYGNLYIADTGNNVIRKVTPGGTITTVAGNGVGGYNGDGQAATSAELNSPWSVAIGPDGLLYIADLSNNLVRKVNASGIISSVAGTGTRGFTGDGGTAATATLNDPAAVVFNPAGDLYIADSGNNRVRRVDTSGNINTIVGNGGEAFGGDNGPAPMASVYAPYALAYDQAGNLYVSDMLHNRIRWIPATPVSLTYPDMKVGKTSAPQVLGLENDGNDSLALNSPAFVNSGLDSATTTCNFSGSLNADQSCNLGVEFMPTTVGASVQGTLTVPSNAGNAPAVVNLSGQVLTVEPVTITLTSTPNPSLLNQQVTFTSTVSSADPNLSGSVTFLDGNTPICSNVVLSGGKAVCTTSTLTLGSHSVTASYGGDANDEAKTSSPVIQVVQQSTMIALTASPNPASVGASVTVSVAITAASGTPMGTVVFYDGGTALTGNVTLVSGAASYSTTSLAPGTHSLTVKYSGDTNDASGTSNTVSEVINQANTTITLSSTNANPYVGTLVTFTANVAGTSTSAPTGTVQFLDGGTVLDTETLSNAGTASYSIASLTPGTHNIVAKYSGDTNNSGSTSSTLMETVQQIPTTTTLTSDAPNAQAGATVHFTATVAINGNVAADGAITGTVTFTSGGTTLGTAPVDSTGKASVAITVQAGMQNVVAAYAGNTNYAASSSSALVETVSTTPTTTKLTSSAATSLSGKSITFTANVSSSTGVPTGSVTFSDSGNTLGSAAVNGSGVATLTTSSLSASTHSITATYGGDTNYVTSTSAPVSEVVSLGSTTLTLAGPSTANVGTTVTLTGAITSNGVTPTGSLTLLDGGASIQSTTVTTNGSYTFTLNSLALGTHTFTVSYGGDSNNGGAVSPAVTTIVQQNTSATALTSSANPATLGQTVTLSVSVTSSGAGLGGTVNFMDGSTSLGSVTLANGSATLQTNSLSFGDHVLTAVYSGDTNHAGSTSAALTEHIVEPASATLASSLNPATSGLAVIFTAKLATVNSLTPSGSVTFRDGANALGVVTLDGTGMATFTTSSLAVGTHSINFTYPGDTNFASATATLTETIQNANTQIVLTSSANPATYGTPLSLTATITSNGGAATGNVTFTEGTTSVGNAVLNASGVAVLTTSTLAPGTHNIVANYAGDGKAGASVSSPLTVTVLQTTKTVLATSANPALTLDSVTLTATVTDSVGVATGTVTFSDGSAQLGVVTLNAAGVATLAVPQFTAGSHPLTASYSGDGSNFPSNSTLTQTVNLRATSTTMTYSATNANNPQQVTLISVVHYAGTTAATGTVTFTTGGNTIGSAPVDATGVATITVLMQSTSEPVVATYNGDASYATSASTTTTVTTGQATQFTISLTPATMAVQAMQHGTLTVNLASVKGFTDMLELGCLGQPYASTCTFSSTQMMLKADGTATVTLTIDTGNPLGSGAAASSVGGSGRMLLLTLPITLLLMAGLWRKGDKRRKLPVLLMALFSLALSLGATGCAGMSSSGVAPGTYTFYVTATGKGTGATQSQAITLTVTK